MTWTSDYHIHTKLCGHAKGEIADFAAHALRVGLTEIGFADHAPSRPDFDPDHRMSLRQFPDYVKQVNKLRKRFPDLTIRVGVEADMHPGFEPFLEKLRRDFPVEFVIGSVHYAGDYFVFTESDSGSPSASIEQVCSYVDLVRHGLASGLVDVAGHLDVIKFGLPHLRDEIRDLCLPLLETIRTLELVMEVNTSGLRKHLEETYPEPDLIHAAARLGIPVCLGSDAHRPGDVGAGFESAKSILSDAGYNVRPVVRNGQRVMIPQSDEGLFSSPEILNDCDAV